uniref:Uncharacterized protein n=1 Tax=Cacopsylla melanoneura TaxID=428564 RepID=A0A8D8QZI7_9HEMI
MNKSVSVILEPTNNGITHEATTLMIISTQAQTTLTHPPGVTTQMTIPATRDQAILTHQIFLVPIVAYRVRSSYSLNIGLLQRCTMLSWTVNWQHCSGVVWILDV